MSRVPESHGARLAPYVAAEESVITGCVEEAAESDGDRAKTVVATDSRIVRLTVTDDEERVESVPFSQVVSASVTVVDAEGRQPAVALAGILLALLGFAGFAVGLGPRIGLGAAIGSQSLLAIVLVASGTLFVAGLAVVAIGLRRTESEVHLELVGVDGSEAYEAVFPRGQLEFAQTVSRLVGTRVGRNERSGSSGSRTHVGPADS